jgi:hypothetical protein
MVFSLRKYLEQFTIHAIDKRISVISVLLFIATATCAQKEFFRSQQTFTREQLSEFYSSITIHDSLLLFNANDYHLYVYNKNDGSLKWSYRTHHKSFKPVFVIGGVVYAGITTHNENRSARIDLTTGKLLHILPFGPLASKPLIRNDMLYGTAIYNSGSIFGYDLTKDTVLWSRSIGHGYSRQPYYRENHIMAHVDADSWLRLDYEGTMLDTKCAVKSNLDGEGMVCVRTFAMQSHDGREIKGKLAEDVFDGDVEESNVICTKNLTYILCVDKLTVLSDKLKKKHQVEIPDLMVDLEPFNITRLLRGDDENVWLLYSDHVLHYNHERKEMVQIADLSAWMPQQVLLDGHNVWLVSGRDGLLYGLSL